MEILNEKGAIGFNTTYDPILDLFASVGGLAPQSEVSEKLKDTLRLAVTFNPVESAIVLFNLRDRLEGMGYRNIFRTLFKSTLGYCNDYKKLIPLIPEYGRWDDLSALIGVNKEIDELIIDIVKKQLAEDLISEAPSLLAKWMPSVNTSSSEAKKLGKFFAKNLGLSEKNYRQTLSRLRSKIKIIENNLRTKDYSFDYSHVPSLAMSKYKNAFERNDSERYSDYLNNVKTGKAKINTSTLNIVDMAKSVRNGGRDLVDIQYDNLPDFGECNALVCMDGSGSMYRSRNGVECIDVAKALTVYCSDRNKTYKNQFITFGSYVNFVTLKGKTFSEKIKELDQYDDCGTTNFEKVFLEILSHAKMYHLTPEQMIDTLIVVSDMQFDDPCCFKNKNKSVYRKLQDMFKEEGFEMPKLVFWNVSTARALPITVDDFNATILSGWSQNMVRYILSGEDITPRMVLEEVTKSPRYAKIAEVLNA